MLRSLSRETKSTMSNNELKKKIIIKKKNFNILNDDSDENEDKENQSSLSDESLRRKTARGSNPTKRIASLKENETESPPKRSKLTEDIDKPLPIISPAISKKTIVIRTKKLDDGEEKKVTSLCLTRKAVALAKDETKVIPETQVID